MLRRGNLVLVRSHSGNSGDTRLPLYMTSIGTITTTNNILCMGPTEQSLLDRSRATIAIISLPMADVAGGNGITVRQAVG
jgi:hypothetical protein